jgi:hypothetical protein
MEERSMRRFEMHLAVFGTLLLFIALVGGCGSSGSREGNVGTSQTSSVAVQKGDNVIAGESSYAGSAACASCHPTQFAGWGKSLHNAPLKTVAELGDAIFVDDANNNGVNDFKENGGQGLDLNDPATDALITATAADNIFAMRPNAPKLSFSGGKFFMTLGAVTYEVQRTQGGNGYWKQRYQTRIGKSYYILPLQYNETTKKYVAYSQGNWFAGATPRLTQAYGSDALVVEMATLNTPATKKGASVSWENRCAGCHQTGLTLEKQTTTYAGTPVDEAVTGYSELNIGCESCHGPGATHAASRNPADIVNPGNFKALGVAGLRQANMVCGRCHSRGEGNFTLAGMNLDTEYYANSSGQFPVPGDNFIDNSAGNPFAILNTSSAYYGAGAAAGSTDPAAASWYTNWYNGFNFTYNFPTYVAAKQHHQQWTDMEQGPHGTDKTFDVTCWSCHDPHAPAGSHQVRETIVESGVTIRTRNDDDSLCLACHAGSGDFADLTKEQIATISTGSPDPALITTVRMHTKHTFNPTASGSDAASRCSGCHMPKTAKSAVNNDIHNHTFLIIKPALSKTTSGSTAGVRNSCDSCHPVGDTKTGIDTALVGDAYLAVLQEAYDIKFR